ncbi:MAG: hypothetical protein ACRC8J_09865, partial [Phocaeicola sp.]
IKESIQTATIRIKVPEQTKAYLTLPNQFKAYSLNGSAKKTYRGIVELSGGEWSLELFLF